MELLVDTLPCLLFEDEHLLVVNKPAGMNTHAPDPYAGEGIYDHLRNRERRWSDLAIIHRLDKETSGLLLFSKTRLANQSLTRQFSERTVGKTYLFLTDRRPPKHSWRQESLVVRAGDRYLSRAGKPGEALAITEFERASDSLAVARGGARIHAVWARPLTGRTHQIRVHAADAGCPILGDVLYGGSPFLRACLHALKIEFTHPANGKKLRFEVLPGFETSNSAALRQAIIPAGVTNAYRLIHGAADGRPGFYLERLGDYLFAQSAQMLSADAVREVDNYAQQPGLRGAAFRLLARQVRRTAPEQASPQRLRGEIPNGPFPIRENGVQFEMSFAEGYSTGLFFDQRDNRRRLLTGHIARDFELSHVKNRALSVLNTFAYTCGFSVCAALGGAQTTSLDLSKKYLEWGKRNFALNGLDPAGHEFVNGDTFDWLKRWSKKGRKFDAVILDPPTFSQSRASGMFRAEKDYPRLVREALGVLNPGGILFASTNAETWGPARFVGCVEQTIAGSGRKCVQTHYAPQPPDFPVSREEPAHLKTLWLRIE